MADFTGRTGFRTSLAGRDVRVVLIRLPPVDKSSQHATEVSANAKLFKTEGGRYKFKTVRLKSQIVKTA